MNADSIKIEHEGDGMWMIVQLDENFPLPTDGRLRFRIQLIAEALYDTVKREIGPWLYERDMAHREYLQDVYDGERQTGQHAPFLCAVEDVDESGGYAADDPKGPRYHSTHADIWDSRAGK